MSALADFRSMRDDPLEGVDRRGHWVLHQLVVHPPRQIYASAAHRRSGRRWTRRHRHTWLPGILLTGAAGVVLAASEMLRSIG
jgi:hypothetical protein